ncbi:hypothetical protein [Enterocloster lavalensis]|uniref:hypothetical protein n=1 Tax=Enterocloster lavalensis TaxID=460384 RepID=UPI0015A6ECB1|nr:hypothetical protein [Enterocloster lavalensis]
MKKSIIVKRKIEYAALSIWYYYGLAVEKLLALKYHAKYFIKHKRLPRKMSSEQVEQLKDFLKEKRDQED